MVTATNKKSALKADKNPSSNILVAYPGMALTSKQAKRRFESDQGDHFIA